MPSGYRYLLAALIIGAGACLAWSLARQGSRAPLNSTWAPLWQLFGTSTQVADKALARVLPIDAVDEKAYGAAIAAEYARTADRSNADYQYVNQVLQILSKFKKKPFDYQAFLLAYPFPNAFALPGGVIVITPALLRTLEQESELAAILAHEMGHIECGHCLAGVKYELLFKKIGDATLGQLADFATTVFLRHSFSKTQESEADEYAFELLAQTAYDPGAMSRAFQRLHTYNQQNRRDPKTADADLVRDYFLTHPPLEIRIEKFTEQARAWWKTHPKARRYLGRKNLAQRHSLVQKDYAAGEWVTAAQAEETQNRQPAGMVTQ